MRQTALLQDSTVSADEFSNIWRFPLLRASIVPSFFGVRQFMQMPLNDV